ncbi:MAG: SCP-2 sterol transfer family protein [Acidimicrobiales bacterium]
MPNPFLSDEWMTEMKALADEAGAGLIPADMSLNLLVTGGSSGDRELHIADGAFGPGFVDAPTKLTVPYGIARSMFIDGDQQSAMQGFMSGQITVQGDMSKLMAMQSSGTGGIGNDLQSKLKEITSPE